LKPVAADATGFFSVILKILVLRFSSIGDIVLSSPVVRCLKKQLGAELHFLSKAAFRPILEANPYLDKTFFFQKEISPALLAELKAEQYDAVIDLHHNLRTLRLKWSLGRPSRSFDKLNFQKWLLVRLGINILPKKHIVERYMATVASLGVAYDGDGLDYFIPNSSHLNDFELPKSPFISFAIGATYATKRLPEDKLIALCRLLANQPVVLLGGPSEADMGERIAKAAGAHVWNLCGALSLHQSALVLQKSQQVISHDTGLMHIAAALRKPIVSLWGSTTPDFGMWPFYPTNMEANTSLKVDGLKCQPCSKIGFNQCPKGHFKCMRELDLQAVQKSVQS